MLLTIWKLISKLAIPLLDNLVVIYLSALRAIRILSYLSAPADAAAVLKVAAVVAGAVGVVVS